MTKRDKHPPKRCPNCGSDDIIYVEFFTISRGNIVWNTRCKTCGWRGEIRPDSDLNYYRVEAQEDWERLMKTMGK